ncbi:hypothetical protein [Cyanobacterium sp. uoEpiScrs1]|uniref:helix-turn-helix transcriptional regulator n=1 Tax=Cyanobacterium sp. uoEpiScrs1 TaxID=2976343 RepID=UPI002B486049|nr:hypothetical protein [Cyanobacterium sp. uoEpiScrs1]
MPAANELSHQTYQKVEQQPPLILDYDSQSVSDTEGQPPLFQAIGTLYGTPHQEEEGKFALTIAGKNYSLFFPGYRYKAWLKQHSNSPESPIYLRVYPKCLLIPRKDPIIRFQVAAWGEENQWEETPGIFKFRGIWQFVPQLRTPVLSIYRNSNATDPQGKFKASHLPVLMRRNDDSRPFKFNPKIPKEQLPKRWFIQAIFKFIPSRNCWGWIEDLELPTERIPRYRKPLKPSVEQHSSQENKKFFVKHQKPDKPSLIIEKKTVATELETQNITPMTITNQEFSKSMVLTRSQMAEKLGISDSTLYKRISQAKQSSDPPMIELNEQRWHYVDNPTGKGKVFQQETQI